MFCTSLHATSTTASRLPPHAATTRCRARVLLRGDRCSRMRPRPILTGSSDLPFFIGANRGKSHAWTLAAGLCGEWLCCWMRGCSEHPAAAPFAPTDFGLPLSSVDPAPGELALQAVNERERVWRNDGCVGRYPGALLGKQSDVREAQILGGDALQRMAGIRIVSWQYAVVPACFTQYDQGIWLINVSKLPERYRTLPIDCD
jgi:hypothetical protein